MAKVIWVEIAGLGKDTHPKTHVLYHREKGGV